jgi:hypothetical protein
VLGWQEKKKATAGKKACDEAHAAVGIAAGKRRQGRRLVAQSATFFSYAAVREDSLRGCWC